MSLEMEGITWFFKSFSDKEDVQEDIEFVRQSSRKSSIKGIDLIKDRSKEINEVLDRIF